MDWAGSEAGRWGAATGVGLTVGEPPDPVVLSPTGPLGTLVVVEVVFMPIVAALGGRAL